MARDIQTGLATILVPAYNCEHYIRDSLDSILSQDYEPMEVFVLDDSSTDKTPDIVSSYTDPRLTLVRQGENLGIYENANRGIERASGEFIAIYHADDIYSPQIVSREVEFLRRHPEAGAVFCKDIFVDAEGREYDRLVLPQEFRGGGVFSYDEVLNGILTYTNTFLRCPGAMVRASAYSSTGIYRQELYKNSSDLDMWLRLARDFPIGIIDDYLFQYRHFVDNSSQRYHHLRTEVNRAFRIVDDHLAETDQTVARQHAIAAFEAHRAEDQLMCVVSRYIRGDMREARNLLRTISLSALISSSQIQRLRMTTLYLGMRIATNLPRIPLLAEAMRRRWHSSGRDA